MANVQRQMRAGFFVMPLALGMQMLAMLLVARNLGTERFGIFSVVFATMNIANFVAEMGMGTIITKLVAERDKPPSHYIALALPLILAASLLAAIVQISVLLVMFPVEKISTAAVLASVNVVLFSQSMVLSCAIRGLGRMGQWMRGFLVHKFVLVLSVLGCLILLDGGIALALLAWTIANLAVFAYYLGCVWGEIWKGQMSWQPKEARALIADSIPVGLISAANQFGMHLDTLILAILLPESAVGMYAAGQRLTQPARQILHGAVSTPAFPGLCRAAQEDSAEFNKLANHLNRIQWMAGLPLAVAGFAAAPLVMPILLPKFTETPAVIWIVAWALPAACVTLQLRYNYIAMSAQSRFLKFSGSYLVVKCALLFLLTKLYGIWGACWASVAAELLFMGLAILGADRQRAKFSLGGGALPAMIVTGAFVAVLWFVRDNQWLMAGMGMAYLAVAAVGVNRLLRSVRQEARRHTDSASPTDSANEPAVPQS